jgi:hypothetical protein
MVLLAGLCACMGGCFSVGGPSGPAPQSTSGAWVEPGPFEAVAMRIHPLTRLDRNREGRGVVMLHVELTDRWGDPCKALGTLRVSATGTGLGSGSGPGSEPTAWTVELFDLEQNARHYDAASRTYRFTLGDVPAWLDAMAPSAAGSAGAGGTVRLDAELRTPASGRSERVLRDAKDLAG